MDAAVSARLIDMGASVRPGKFSLKCGPLSAIPLANGKSSTIGRMFLKQFRMGFSRLLSSLRDSSRFVSSWWIGAGFTTKARRREESPSFWLRLRCVVEFVVSKNCHEFHEFHENEYGDLHVIQFFHTLSRPGYSYNALSHFLSLRSQRLCGEIFLVAAGPICVHRCSSVVSSCAVYAGDK